MSSGTSDITTGTLARCRFGYDYFNQAMKSLAAELQNAGVEYKQVLLETIPPIGISAQEEKE